MTTLNIAVLAGDGIGPEITEQAVAVLERLAAQGQFALNLEHAAVGGAGYRAKGHTLPEETMALAQASDAVLFGSVGDFHLDHLPRELRPEQAILGLRKRLELFANLRPAFVFPDLVDASTLKPEIVSGMDILIVRELTGDIYFGQPRGVRRLDNGDREGFDTMVYNETEIRRIGRVAFEAAAKRSHRLCSVDKANVLETTQLWRNVMTELAADYPNIELSHIYVDNAAMQLLKNPKQFDVMVTGNMFGDILSDEASMLTGSIGMLASASLDSNNKGLYEPIHGSAPDIAGQDKANPLATILSAAMMLRYSFGLEASAQAIEQAVSKVLSQGYATADIQRPGAQMVGTKAMGQAVVAALG